MPSETVVPAQRHIVLLAGLLSSTVVLDGRANTPVDPSYSNGHYQISRWGTGQGLPQNTVNALLQSKDGYLWMGTRLGLARYDGLTLTDLTGNFIEEAGTDMDIRGFVEDKDGDVWLHTPRRLIRYREGCFEPQFSCDNASHSIYSLAARQAGGVWIGRDDGVFWFESGKELQDAWFQDLLKEALASDARSRVTALFEDAQGSLWVRLAKPNRFHWLKASPGAKELQPLTNIIHRAVEDIAAVLPDSSGTLWLARPGELLAWDGQTLRSYSAESAWGQSGVTSIKRDLHGNLWISSTGNTQLHCFSDGEFTSYGRGDGFLHTEDVRCIRPDREGNLWVGTGSGGCYRFQPRQLVALLSGSRSTMDEVYSVAPGRNSRVWLATTYGLVRFQDGQFSVFTNAWGLGVDNIRRVRTVFEHSSGEVFASLDFGGVLKLCGNTFCPIPCGEFEGPSTRRWVNSFAEDSKGALWVGTQKGLMRWANGECQLWTTNQGLSANETLGLVCGPDGTVWVGTRGGGLNEFRQGYFRTYSEQDGLLSQEVWPLRSEPDGSVWVGTPAGIHRIRGGEIRAVTMKNGLFDNLAYCLLEDRFGNYWTFCNRGIWRMKKAELHAAADGRISRVHCVTYGEEDGMVSAEGNGDQYPNAAFLPNGQLWFPTTRGVVILDPEHLRDNEVRPLMVIEEVRVDGKTAFRDGGCFTRDGIASSARNSLTIGPGQGGVIELRYTATTFIDSSKTQFRYRLEGHDADWREVGTQRVAFYTNLRPGNYRFVVEACNSHGYWSEQPAAYSFVLKPYFFETRPFYVASAVIFLTVMGAWHLHRLNNARRVQQLRQERALQDERTRIAKDLHDDLGANLTGLALQIELARRQVESPEAVEAHLESSAGAVRSMVDGMRQVIWSINPQCDTLESFCTFCCQYAENFLASAGLRCRLDMPEQMPERTLSAEVRYHLVLVMKEALNNAARHAGATEVLLSVNLEGDRLQLDIADNGQGFVTAQSRDGNSLAGGEGDVVSSNGTNGGVGAGRGLSNMRRRVETLGGNFELTTERGRGTRVRASVPLSRVHGYN